MSQVHELPSVAESRPADVSARHSDRNPGPASTDNRRWFILKPRLFRRNKRLGPFSDQELFAQLADWKKSTLVSDGGEWVRVQDHPVLAKAREKRVAEIRTEGNPKTTLLQVFRLLLPYLRWVTAVVVGAVICGFIGFAVTLPFDPPDGFFGGLIASRNGLACAAIGAVIVGVMALLTRD